MPEGDTVRRHALLLTPLLVGQPLVAASSRWPGVVRGLPGVRVLAVESVGKHLLLSLDDDTTLRIHLGMKGAWRKAGSLEVLRLSPGDMSLRLDTPDAAVICTRAPTVERFATREIPVHPVLSALGPDVLGDGFDPEVAVDRATASPAATLAELLLDQRVACGIGNVYKSELCFLERLHPLCAPRALDRARLVRTYERARELMGRNLGPGPRNTTRLGPGRPDTWVYGRVGRPCLRCGTPVDSALHGTSLPRITFWCPRCQDARIE